MKQIFKFIILMIISHNSILADTWEFINNEDFVPSAQNSLFLEKQSWKVKNITADNGQLICSNLIYGLAIYENKVWKYYTPEFIFKNLYNPDELTGFDLSYINIRKTKYSPDGSLWLLADKYILKYDGNKFYVYASYKQNNGEIINLYQNYGMAISEDNKIVVEAGYFKNENDTMKLFISMFSIENNNLVETFKTNNSDYYYLPTIFALNNGNIITINRDSLKEYSPAGEVVKRLSSKQILPLVSGTNPSIIYDAIQLENDTVLIISNELKTGKYYEQKYTIDSVFRAEENNYRKPVINAYYWNFEQRVFLKKKNNNEIYVCASDSNRIFYKNTAGEIITIFIPPLPGKSSVTRSDLMAIDTLGRIWLLYKDYGIYVFYPYIADVKEINEGIFPDVWIWSLYPNPANDKALVKFFLDKSVASSVEAEVIDLLGNKIKDISKFVKYDIYSQEAQIEFSTESIPTGTYFVCINAGKSKKLKQLQIVR